MVLVMARPLMVTSAFEHVRRLGVQTQQSASISRDAHETRVSHTQKRHTPSA